MSLPAGLKITFRPGVGPLFANSLVLGDALNGILGANVLGGSAQQPIEITNLCRQVSIRRGRDRQFDRYNAGTCTIELLDQNGDFNPDNSSSPYFGELLPGRQLRVSASYNSIEAFLFSGYITNYRWRWDPGFDAFIVTISAQDGFRFLAAAEIGDVPGAAPGDDSGTRAGLILDAALWPPSLRKIDPAGVPIQLDSSDRRTVLQALQAVELSELGATYLDPAGNVVFRTRQGLGQQAAGTATQFTDDPDAPGPVVRYQSLSVELDDQEIINEVTAQRLGGTAQTESDLDSIQEYFARSRGFDGLLVETDEAARSFALQLVNYRSQPTVEVRAVAIEMMSNDPVRIEAGLTLDIGDPLDVTRTTVGGALSTRLTIQGVQHDIRLDDWRITYSTAEPFSVPFILGSAIYGILGTSTL